MNRYALSPSKMQLQLRTAIQSSGNKAKKGRKREQLKAKKCEKRENGVRGVVEKRRAGTAGKRTIDIYTRRLERKRRRKSPHKTKQEIHLYTRTRKGNSRC